MAKANVVAHATQPATEMARWRACQSRAAQRRHYQRDQISGHANGEKQPPRHIA
jgi:hypothetical protein